MIRVHTRMNSTDVLDALTDLFIHPGPPLFTRSDPEVTPQVRDSIELVGQGPPKSTWIALEKPYRERFNPLFRNELLHGDVFYSLREAQITIERCRKHYDTRPPHSALGYRALPPEVFIPIARRPMMQ